MFSTSRTLPLLGALLLFLVVETKAVVVVLPPLEETVAEAATIARVSR